MRTIEKSRTFRNDEGEATLTLTVTVGREDGESLDWDTRQPVKVPTRVSIVGDVREGYGRSSGQCQDTVRRVLADVPEALRICDLWDRWHLNDMRAACKHQTDMGPGWDTGEDLTIYHWRLTDEAVRAKQESRKGMEEKVVAGRVFAPTAEDTRLMRLEYRAATHLPEPPSADYQPAGPIFRGDNTRHTEVKKAGWVRPEEHPGGLLCKACPVCGYQYGSAWLYEPVPDEVLKELVALFGADSAA